MIVLAMILDMFIHANLAKRGMLARLAATLRSRQPGMGGLGGPGEGENATVVLDDNCLVCLLPVLVSDRS